ncbi:N-acyl homoserine lactonase family protein [Sphaerimonospora mesophila]|uniref:N-acyl homoserine lactonase family protein n=1 Tax=Sphaerimonospora mesophila TaxID=37483 RepID=UPI0006E24366
MKLYVLDGGRIEILDWARFQPDAGPGVRRWISDSCYLIVHPRGTLMWDTGLPDRLAGVAEGHTIPGVAVFHVTEPLADRLTALGHPPHEIDFLALSHFHPDHVGNVELFRGATLLVQGDEYAAAFGASPGDHGFDPQTYAVLRERPVAPLHGDHDVFGDGTVVIKRLPGHTPGSQSLLVRLPDTGSVLVSGDLVHSMENWTRRVVPTFNSDPQETVRSLELADRVLAEENATLWVQHDLDQQSALRHGPAFYT